MTVRWLDPLPAFADAGAGRIIPVCLLRDPDTAPKDGLKPADLAYARALDWKGKPGNFLAVRDRGGRVLRVLLAVGAQEWRRSGIAFPTHALPLALPHADPDGAPLSYRLDDGGKILDAETAALGWLLGSHRPRPKKSDNPAAALLAPDGVCVARIRNIAVAVGLARRLIDAPANRLGPDALEAAAAELANRHGADFRCVAGDALLEENWPLVHAVGRASASAPRLLDIAWGDADAPRVTLVGKGVVFDTGGLDIKPPRAMRLMKKDMGGAATALALAHMVMAQGLPVRLRVLLPVVENAVGGNAIRPGDILAARNGKTVEIGDTDAEGRLILADALVEASSGNPELLVDFATLTGTASAALGAELPALFTESDALAEELCAAGLRARDPVWRLPLWHPYARSLKVRLADLSSTGEDTLGGAITAALFLHAFVKTPSNWAHFDLHAWNPKKRPGMHAGGACQAARAVFDLLEQRYPAP